jgi:signal transduction histidine kinase
VERASPTSPRLAWTLVALIAALVAPAIVLLILAFGTPLPAASFGFRGWGVPLAVALATAGFLIASRVPTNRIGWLLLIAGVGTAVQELAQQYANYGLFTSPGALPGADVAAWVTEWIWIPSMAVLAMYLPLNYPDGHLPSPRWWSVAVVGTVGMVLGTVCFALAPGDLESFPGVRNPVGIEGAGWIRAAGDAVMVLFVAGFLGAIASLAIRYRRARGDERHQLKWLLLALCILMVCLLAGVPYWTLRGEGTAGLPVVETILVLALVAIPAAIGVAILKFRLYDVDLVIKKTVVYAVLAVLLFAVGAAAAWAAGGLVFTASGQSEYSWLLAGVVVGASIWPLRRLATRISDRLVFGRRATPYQVLSEFSDRVAGMYASDDVLDRMAQVLAAAVGADAATVWLHDRRGFHPGATWPLDAAPAEAIPPSAIEVRHQDDVLGALSVSMPANDPMDPTKERLISDLAAQAGLVLRNAALIDDLKASRVRLVAAPSEERRRIERNIHDGAQQQLVALAVKQRLASTLIGKDDEGLRTLLTELQIDTNQALEDLRDLARGIYPPLLADKGLPAALESQARKSSVRVTVDTDGIGRYPQEAESAVYFSCLEALQNVAKYAEASSATVRLAQTNGSLVFEVVDDGKGFDPEAAERGSGLEGIADRLAALGGTLTVRSAPGAGTTITGTLPVEGTS